MFGSAIWKVRCGKRGAWRKFDGARLAPKCVGKPVLFCDENRRGPD
jgi:hypothetical protein